MVKGMCRDWMISIRRACGALNFDRSTYHYTSRRADQAVLERRIREICEIRVRYGYRRVHVLLEREGWGTNIKRTYRIYRELGCFDTCCHLLLSLPPIRTSHSSFSICSSQTTFTSSSKCAVRSPSQTSASSLISKCFEYRAFT